MKSIKLILILTGIILSLSTTLIAQTVNIYSSRQEFLIRPLLDSFTEKTGIKAKVVFIKKGMLERLKAEGKNSPADVILTTDIANLLKMAESNLFQKINSDKVNKNIPSNYRNSDGLWVGLTARARIIYYSKTRVKTSELSNYGNLGNPKWKGRICTRSGLHDYNIALVSSMVARHGIETTERWLGDVKSNLARKPQGNDRAQVKAIYLGLCDIAIGNTYYMGKMLGDKKQIKWANSVSIYFPNQAGRGTHVNISGGAISIASKNKANAIKLIEFLTGDEAQKLYASVNHEYPLKKGIAYSSIVSGFGAEQAGVTNGHFKMDSIDLNTLVKHRTDVIKMMHRIQFD